MKPKRAMPECRSMCSRVMIIVCVVMTVALLLILWRPPVHAGSAEEYITENVSLDKKYLEAEEAFKRACGKCHEAPDPAKTTCISDLKQADLLSIQDYLHEMSEGPTASLDCLEPEGKPIFENTCGKCHALPNPAKPNCISEMPREDLSLAHIFLERVREGKELYESRCSGCHKLISPSSHSFEYWSKHLCAKQGKLDGKGQQTVLLYLKSHSKE